MLAERPAQTQDATIGSEIGYTRVTEATKNDRGKSSEQAYRLELGDIFRDCPTCPEMVRVPAGSFMMGPNDRANKKPVRKVTIAKPVGVGRFEVTFAEWDACVAAGACAHTPDDKGWGRGNRPVINVSWDNVTKQYLPWLNQMTGKTYRLLSETEWE